MTMVGNVYVWTPPDTEGPRYWLVLARWRNPTYREMHSRFVCHTCGELDPRPDAAGWLRCCDAPKVVFAAGHDRRGYPRTVKNVLLREVLPDDGQIGVWVPTDHYVTRPFRGLRRLPA